ncbi:MAG: O-antigen ligase family protein [Acidobacteria bacterium]|uniref:O-antigen ligase family protein n=1 Tax=Candidatus Polarisedimenticola svalbardensis TaxID=2886004 RepID=A0A8J6Y5D7_9BACT|nr:O-antigen ligase family protein [Candidatus Polarisedimenticola svalbardensis]
MTWLTEGPASSLEAEDWPLLAAVCALPWAFGGVEIWAYRSAAFLIVVAAFIAVSRSGWEGILPARDRRWLVLPLLLGLWGLFQCVPLPPVAVNLLSPHAAAIYRDAAPPLEDRAMAYLPGDAAMPQDSPAPAMETPSGYPWRSLSLYPAGTLERSLWFLALFLAFLLAGRRSSKAERCTVYKVVLLANMTLLALVGIMQLFHDNGKLLWIRESARELRSIGPYVNPNHFGGVMELAVPWLLGYSWWRFRKGGIQAIKEPQAPVALGAGLLCLVAGFFSASKMTAALIALGLVFLVLLCLRSLRSRVLALTVVVVLAAVAFFGLGGTELAQRVEDFSSASAGDLAQYERVVVWKAALPMVADYPLTGVGFGAFGQVFSAYVPPGETRLWLQLHNDYLEVLVEGGLVAGLLLLALMWAYGSRLFRMQLAGTLGRTVAPARIGMVVGLVCLSLHALVDFNHQIPGNALMFVVVAAVAMHRHSESVS